MPTEKRGDIGMVKPSGWHTVKYPDIIKDRYLYNRCHLIGFQLAGENANVKNLITGTRYLNVEGMLPFENEVADYVKETGNHVLYRVTPIFDSDNLVASGAVSYTHLFASVCLMATPVYAAEPVDAIVPVSCSAEGSTESFAVSIEGDSGFKASPERLELRDGESKTFTIQINLPGDYKYKIYQEKGTEILKKVRLV